MYSAVVLVVLPYIILSSFITCNSVRVLEEVYAGLL